MTAWKVKLHGKEIDTVFGHEGSSPEDVKRSLVNHDGYDSAIVVTKERKKSARASRPKKAKLSGSKAIGVVRDIVETLYPAADPDHEWSSDELEAIGGILHRAGLVPTGHQ